MPARSSGNTYSRSPGIPGSLLVDAGRMGHRLVVIIGQVVRGDLVSVGLPYPVMGHDVVQHLAQVLGPLRAAHDIRVEGDAHQPAALLSLCVELVKLRLADPGVVVG